MRFVITCRIPVESERAKFDSLGLELLHYPATEQAAQKYG